MVGSDRMYLVRDLKIERVQSGYCSMLDIKAADSISLGELVLDASF